MNPLAKPPFDTSGVVHALPPGDHQDPYAFRWEDLDDFVQGALTEASGENARLLGRSIGFADWSGEALATLLREMEAFRTLWPHNAVTRAQGQRFWTERSAGSWGSPLILFRGDADGKFHLREAI